MFVHLKFILECGIIPVLIQQSSSKSEFPLKVSSLNEDIWISNFFPKFPLCLSWRAVCRLSWQAGTQKLWTLYVLSCCCCFACLTFFAIYIWEVGNILLVKLLLFFIYCFIIYLFIAFLRNFEWRYLSLYGCWYQCCSLFEKKCMSYFLEIFLWKYFDKSWY